jgi:hypothetical protein
MQRRVSQRESDTHSDRQTPWELIPSCEGSLTSPCLSQPSHTMHQDRSLWDQAQPRIETVLYGLSTQCEVHCRHYNVTQHL